jgi:riboflavin kinase
MRAVRPVYFACGKVVTGFGRGGKDLGCPTANLDCSCVAALPSAFECGVYCGWANVDDGRVYPMVMSIGWNPTFQNDIRTMEVHLLDYGGEDFYGALLKLCIVGYLRPQYAFNSLSELTTAIENDKSESKHRLLDTNEWQIYRSHAYFNENGQHTIIDDENIQAQKLMDTADDAICDKPKL